MTILNAFFMCTYAKMDKNEVKLYAKGVSEFAHLKHANELNDFGGS